MARRVMFSALAIVLGAVLTLAALAVYSLWVPGHSHSGPQPALSAEERQLAERLKSHIVTIASEPHSTQYPEALERSAVAIEAAFRAAGYEPRTQAYDSDGTRVRNIWVEIAPAETAGDAADAIVVGAHYDSAHDAPGANDNGSGTAAILELARLLKPHTPKRTRLSLVAFVNEEAPFWGGADQGAARFADKLVHDGSRLRGMISLETLGWFDQKPGSQRYPKPFNWIYPDVGDFVAFVGMPGSRAWLHDVIEPFRRHAHVASIGGIAPSYIPGIAWSDHAPFADRGIPAIMLTDTAPFRYPHYHRATDTPDKVDVAMLARITLGVHAALLELAP